MKDLSEFLPELILLRKELHHHPEISGKEFKTSRLLFRYCQRFKPDHIIEKIGRTGLALIFEGKTPGKTILFRAEMDALPMEEDIEISYSSDKKSLSHKCGHDGHMAILVGLAFCLHNRPISGGRVVLLFQPAEEVGKGAIAILNDPKFKKIIPDFVFALHNLPGYGRNSIIVKDHIFAMASEGISIRLKGHAAHAAYPDQGISPLPAITDLITKILRLNGRMGSLHQNQFVTITHSQFGRFGYGTVPGTAMLNISLRALCKKDLDKLHREVVKITGKIALKNFVEEKIQRWEPFEATVNDSDAVEIVKKVAGKNNFPVVVLAEPIRWSEDFGQFTMNFPGALFGLGAGENQSDLHTSYYDFPDEILQTGIAMFHGILQELLHD